MKYTFDGFNYVVRLSKGELLVENLTKLIKDQKILGGWISGLGACTKAELGFYDLTAKNYQWKKFDQLMEITSLQGNLSWQDDQPTLHIHGTFSDSQYQAIGGHVKELEVGGTCEIFIHFFSKDKKLNRSADPETGLNLLDL